ncbi:hypothetical protein GLOTRDRAFT_104535 [Gloeophyllum trabeum ATCC 11539]|uniref:Mitochondrial adapter protein MCP1 transmembrane domain-containing protein n=1 Tax=Gloeophyllum trabeum (strain ATCC 11539 / FP-39264 / Madison 617) TaxID=670483 RepID=S7QHQ1_GLOTA|nr:uncharacterized protein GLOTRDRAFT_104535 [Gloeophyllum trabeum ATCC 11539]EPQ58707.1 hypothetical protein GLOTRDRAFT_104535 [Gloeophyllum trabeum ATCC 11539]
MSTPGNRDAGSPQSPRPWRAAALPWLTRAAQGSSAFIGTFLAIHLTAPLLANLGGSSLASQVMLLGREYYQTPLGEAALVLGPIAVHAATAATKRLLAPRRARPLASALALTGYATLFVFLPAHFVTHRLNPTYSGPPVYAVGPAELDYEFVKVGLQTWPWRSWILYTGLVAGVAVHAAEGMNIILSTLVKNRKRWSARARRLAALLAAVPVLSGAWVMAREPLMTFSSLALRYHESFTRSYLFRL